MRAMTMVEVRAVTMVDMGAMTMVDVRAVTMVDMGAVTVVNVPPVAPPSSSPATYCRFLPGAELCLEINVGVLTHVFAQFNHIHQQPAPRNFHIA